ncbi:hypothetical protein WJX84_000611 [Apatococcus fuscideae]|uniref:Xaa-Pro dipeptidase n=1 Tax=Apatococcus fuscideae TaxID=2026836 RepID=A0AAW1SLT7_9CHLO
MAGHMAPETFEMGPSTLRVSRKALHSSTRRKCVEAARSKLPKEKQGIVLLQGGSACPVYSTDAEVIFRQESFFHYLFGVEEEDYFGAIDLRSSRTILFMPRLPEAYAVWMGHIHGPEHMKHRYAVDDVFYTEDMQAKLAELKPPTLHVLLGVNSDSGSETQAASFQGIDQFQVDKESLFSILAECRVRKTPEELAVLKYANKIGSAAHVEVMRQCQPGMMEYGLESTFLHSCYLGGGCRHTPYTPICASGPSGHVLHYGHAGAPNSRQVQDGDFCLLDMGCEYYRYGSDITCSFPANGKFTADQRVIYEAVLSAHAAVLAEMRPGIAWPEMQLLAERHILGGLKNGGFLKGDVSEMVEARVGALFMPHGLGHLLGIDTHDIGGYLPHTPPRPTAPGLKSLRTARILEENMVITVEPGCYFNPALLEPAMAESEARSKFLINHKIQHCMDFGGVRIEDDVIVTANGCQSMTIVPRSVHDIESVMAGGSWPAQ